MRRDKFPTDVDNFMQGGRNEEQANLFDMQLDIFSS
jgi:hypothetical protein